MSKDRLKVHISGMGGQGVGATSRILTYASQLAGLSVSSMETHGLAQRGGVVVSDIAIGYGRESPLCANGEADVLLTLEALEALRSMVKLRKDGIAVVNTTKYQPLSVRISRGEVKYPTLEEIKQELKKRTPNVIMVDADKTARNLGISLAMNVVLIGALCANTDILPFTEEQLKEAIKAKIPQKFVGVNMAAFSKGKETKIS
ncbi:MAG: indolepyruvate oxidoreductase subunit beta [Candidatus Lokiarchaeota archaeon]|nr:indolepyruvate oxidoreductase subunit beta [Candidatus Lokiarchaeota archaeon]